MTREILFDTNFGMSAVPFLNIGYVCILIKVQELNILSLQPSIHCQVLFSFICYQGEDKQLHTTLKRVFFGITLFKLLVKLEYLCGTDFPFYFPIFLDPDTCIC